MRKIVRKENKVVGRGIGERKWRGNFRRRIMIFGSSIDVRCRDLGMEETRGGRERVQEKYLRGVLGVDREMPGYILRKECKRNRLRVKASGKVSRQNDRREEGRILTECWKEKKKNTGKRVCQWRSKKIESKRKMDECGAEWKGHARQESENQRIKVQQIVWEVYDRGNSGVPGERECKKQKNAGEILMEGEERKYRMCYEKRERQSSTCGMNLAKWQRGRERSEENEDGREMG
jgi:hypothetical protein